MTENDTELPPSELGKLEFWENTYALELENLNDHGDVGKIWFGETTASKVVRCIESKLNVCKEEDKIIDLGCGNGMMLVDLATDGYKKLIGLDYSDKAIKLAAQVLERNKIEGAELMVCDITSENQLSILDGAKVVHDKGTYDAISLNPEGAKNNRSNYIANVNRFLAPDGYFIITSCNWTKDELSKHFEEKFKLYWEIPNKTFSFGGKTGSRVTQLVFIKKSKED